MKRAGYDYANVDGKESICFFFSYDMEIIWLIRTIPGAYWNPELKCWVIPKNAGPVDELNDQFLGRLEFVKVEAGNSSLLPVPVRFSSNKDIPDEKIILHSEKNIISFRKNFQNIDPVDLEKIKSFTKWMEFRRYSRSTIRTYYEMVTTFLRFISPKRATEEVGDDVQRFTNEYILPKKLSYSYQNQMVNALKLFYRETIGQPLTVNQVRRPRPVHTLPNVLSKQEVKKILVALRNIKHRAMLSMIYACGLRRGELLNIKPTDIDSIRGILFIRKAKGNRDRVVPVSGRIKSASVTPRSHFAISFFSAFGRTRSTPRILSCSVIFSCFKKGVSQTVAFRMFCSATRVFKADSISGGESFKPTPESFLISMRNCSISESIDSGRRDA